MVRSSRDTKPSYFFSPGRLWVIFFICLVLVGYVFVQLYHLQVEEGDIHASRKHGVKVVSVNPPRGRIFIQDRDGDLRQLVATNKNAFRVLVRPPEINDSSYVLNNLSFLLEEEEDEDKRNQKYIELLQYLNNKELTRVIITNRIDKEQKARVERTIARNDLEGVYIETAPFRYYPNNDLGAQFIGFLGYSESNVIPSGRYGIERSFNKALAGEPGLAQALPEFDISEDKVYMPGVDITLTIDQTVQFKVEQELAKAVQYTGAESGNALFMNPKTGEILAMANVPSFDLNAYNEVDPEQQWVFNNNTVQGRYEMGSVFKPLTMAFAIDAGSVTPHTVYDDTGSIKIGDDTITNVEFSPGVKTMTEVLESSLNTGVVFALEEMGTNAFLDYVHKFQMGDKTFVDLPEEASNDIRNIADTNIAINYATATFGQGIAFTPIRFLTSFAALANNGVMMKPYIVDRVENRHGTTHTYPEELGRPIAASTAKQITQMLVSTSESQYYRTAQIPGRTIATKTGTAQIACRGSYDCEEVLHSFVGYAPANNPRFIGLIILVKPTNIEFASISLSPVFREIGEFMLNYYEVPYDNA